ncbi:hypothetical protein ALON55S_00951 [Alishewanella longhuensis]
MLISNHDTTWTRKIYHQAELHSIDVARSISQKGQSRGKVAEVFALYLAKNSSDVSFSSAPVKPLRKVPQQK